MVLIQVEPLTLITGNTYCLDLVLDRGEGDLFKYYNAVPFVVSPSAKKKDIRLMVGS